MEIKDYVIQKVSSEEYYRKRFPQWNGKKNVACPWHTDKSPSLAINLKNGGAKCFASSCSIGSNGIGNIVHFESLLTRVSEEEAATNLYSEFVRPICEDTIIETFQRSLKESERATSLLARSTGLSAVSIDRFRIGYDTRSNRFTFPIENQFGNVVNIRFFRPKSIRKSGDIKIYSLVINKGEPTEQRFGSIELFPWSFFKSYHSDKPLFIMASEKETMLAIQYNLQAICATAGEGNWPKEYEGLLSDYNVGIVFDQDKGGDSAWKRIIATLQNECKSLSRIILPFPLEYKGDTDFDDWILSKNGNQFALLNLLKQTSQHIKSEKFDAVLPASSTDGQSLQSPIIPPVEDETVYDLAHIRSDTELLNKVVRTRGIIAAVSTKSFDIPWKFKVKTKKSETLVSLPIGRDLISLAGCGDRDVQALLELQSKDKIISYEAVEYTPVSEVEVIPVADLHDDSEARYTIQRCFTTGRSFDSNTPYELSVIPTTLTKTQEKVCIITGATNLSAVVDTWTFDEKTLAQFETFRPQEGQTVSEKLEQIAEEIATNHSRIYSRMDWHLVCLLTYFSPIGFSFPGETGTQRGWINALAIGDTQTGKSQVVTCLQRLLRLGEIVNAENCTFVGLVGGAIKTGNGQMMLRWGKLPLCDRKLVVVEELSGLSVEDISNMSEVRSRGIARLDKAGLSSQTPARTRFLALSNVRPMQKNLAQYLSGVKAIQELIGHPEDISRFDLIVTLVDSEVSSDIINSANEQTTEATFTPSQLQHLCQFAWSLKPSQVAFDDSAYLLCLEWTKRLQGIYHPSIPIFKAASGRLLLARVGAAIATLQFNWDGKVIRIEEAHIEAAVDFLRSLYDKPSFGYLAYSQQMQDRETVKLSGDLNQILRQNFKSEIVAEVLESLIHAGSFTRDELAATGSLALFQADAILGAFLRARIVRKGISNTWEITKSGRDWMMEIINERTKISKPKISRAI